MGNEQQDKEISIFDSLTYPINVSTEELNRITAMSDKEMEAIIADLYGSQAWIALTRFILSQSSALKDKLVMSNLAIEHGSVQIAYHQGWIKGLQDVYAFIINSKQASMNKDAEKDADKKE